MGISSLSPQLSRTSSLSLLVAPFQALVLLFMPNRQAGASNRGCVNQSPKSRPARSCSIDKAAWRIAPCAPGPTSSVTHAAVHSRLKIVREFDPGVGASCAGRMVISGRMADVCAELDRMAQDEPGWPRGHV
jgi:hypothetical protein